jgi:hypothetical protein
MVSEVSAEERSEKRPTETSSNTPLRFSFHKLTLPSPLLTARTFPLTLQLTLQTTSPNLPSPPDAGVAEVWPGAGVGADEAVGSSATLDQGARGES